MKFEIHAERQAGDTAIFYYDNMTNVLTDSKGYQFRFPADQMRMPTQFNQISEPFDKDHPLKKSKLIKHLKIQMGLSCNYTCDYCSQKFVERAPETNKDDVESFMQKLEVLEFDEDFGLKVEFWGGEPLVYWKTLKPLAEAIKAKFKGWKKKPQLSIITNGSLLTEEIIDWLMMMDFSVSISHDGPGQSVRGPDPFDDPKQKELLLGFYRMMTRLGKSFSFNAMLNSKNSSRKAIYDWFVNLTGDPKVNLGEGGMVDAYDEDGMGNSLNTLQEHFEFRRTAFADIFTTYGNIGFTGQLSKINNFTTNLLNQRPAKFLGQKCGMDDANTIAVDLRGNVITCQNVSAVEISKNGERHFGGSLDDYKNVELKSVTHWSNRKECPECPVLHICQGACMFLDKEYWEVSCANAYSDTVALFALALEKITNGYIPTLIKSETLPLERQDIFGTIYQHEEKSGKRVIPIKVVSEKVGAIEGVEVYGKARVEINS